MAAFDSVEAGYIPVADTAAEKDVAAADILD